MVFEQGGGASFVLSSAYIVQFTVYTAKTPGAVVAIMVFT